MEKQDGKKWDWKKAGSIVWRILPWLWLLAGYVVLVWYQLVPGRWLVDGDISSQMVLAKLLNEEKSILTHNWFYSTELHVFHYQWFFRFALLIFPNNWHLARTLTIALIMLVFVLAYLYMSYSLGFPRMGVWTAGAMLWPFGRLYFYEVGFTGCYAIYIIYACFAIGLISSLAWKKHRRWKKLLLAGLLAFSSAASGLNGVRQMMMTFAPLFVGMALVFWLEIRRKKVRSVRECMEQCRETIRLSGWIIFATCFNIAGYLFNYKVLSQKYDFVKYNFVQFDKIFTIDSLLAVWSDLLSLFGYQNKVYLYTLGGIASLCGLAFAALIVFSLVRLCMRYRTLNLQQKLILMTAIAGLLVCGSIFAFSSVYFQGYHSNYWIPLVPVILAMVQIELDTESFDWAILRQWVYGVFSGVVTLAAVGAILYEYHAPLNGEHNVEEAVNAILASGYTQGYASHWSASAITELTDGKVEVISVNVNNLEVEEWLQKREYLDTVPEGPVFILIDRFHDTDIDSNPFALSGKGDIFLDSVCYWAVGYESMEEVYQILEDAGVSDM